MRLDQPNAIIQEADSMARKVQEAQEMAAIKNAAKRHAERMAKYRAWVDPEAIARRREQHEREAAAALAATKAALGTTEEEPIPDDLPPHMRGQSPSTIRKMLKHEREAKMSIGLERTLEKAEAPKPLVIEYPPPKPRRWYQRLLDWLLS